MKSYKPIALEKGKYYHIYNRGNNGIDIFFDYESYYHFLRLYDKYISPIAETFAWCLLKNHFHVLVYIKIDEEIDISMLEYSTVESPKTVDPSKQFGHLFNAYTQAINKKFNRTGSLFEKPFERKLVKSEKYFQNLIYYIHNNPVFHRFTDKINDYPWSSYETVLSEKPTRLVREKVIKIFETKDNFIQYHFQKQNCNEIINLIIE